MSAEPALLEVEGLVAFYGRAQILFDVSFRVGRGEVVALLGRNGAGKSTTLKSLIGLVAPAAGRVVLAGERIDGLPAHSIARRGLGYVPEERRVFAELTVDENLEVGRQPPRPGVPEWTRERLFDLFPNLSGMRDRPAGRMSGGEQQMLAIARTLMGNPACLLLDEPSEGLAPTIVEAMIAALHALKSEGLTVLLSEQNLRLAEAVADRACVMQTGHVLFEGPVAALRERPEVREAYLAP